MYSEYGNTHFRYLDDSESRLKSIWHPPPPTPLFGDTLLMIYIYIYIHIYIYI